MSEARTVVGITYSRPLMCSVAAVAADAAQKVDSIRLFHLSNEEPTGNVDILDKGENNGTIRIKSMSIEKNGFRLLPPILIQNASEENESCVSFQPLELPPHAFTLQRTSACWNLLTAERGKMGHSVAACSSNETGNL